MQSVARGCRGAVRPRVGEEEFHTYFHVVHSPEAFAYGVRSTERDPRGVEFFVQRRARGVVRRGGLGRR